MLDELTAKSTDRDIALKFMEAIMYDNGWVNAQQPEWFSPKWTKAIAPIAGRFFKANPSVLNDETVELIATGEGGEVEVMLGQLEGFEELTDILNDYFEDSGES